MNTPQAAGVADSGCLRFGPADWIAAVNGDLDEFRAELLAEHTKCCEVCRSQIDRLMAESRHGSATIVLASICEDKRFDQMVSRIDVEPPKPEEFQQGDMIGRYRVVSRIGRGGYSKVYDCFDPNLGRHVAVKVLFQSIHQASVASRMNREARLLAQLDHPGIVRVIDFEDFGHEPYIIMELVAGGASNRLVEHGPLEPRLAAKLVAAVARALAYAHEMGVLHRDIKPSNLLVVRDFDENGPIPEDVALKISDFGLARPMQADSRMTTTHGIVGTPAYMAPEQAKGEGDRIGPAADLYSLGAVLYEFLVGRPPLVSGDAVETLRLIVEREPIEPLRIQPGIPRDLNTICMKCLRKDPAERYATALELADDLERFLERRPIMARPIPWFVRCLRWCQRNRRLAASLAVSAVLVVVSAVGGAWFGIEQSRLLEVANSAVVDAQIQRRQAEAATRAVEANREMASKERDAAVRMLDEATTALFWAYTQVVNDKALAASPEMPRLKQFMSIAFNRIASAIRDVDVLEREKPEYLCGLLFKTAIIEWQSGAIGPGAEMMQRLIDIYSRIPEPTRNLDGLTMQVIVASSMLGDDSMKRNDPEKAIEVLLSCWNEFSGKGETWLREAKISRGPLLQLGQQLCAVLKRSGREAELRRIESQMLEIKRFVDGTSTQIRP